MANLLVATEDALELLDALLLQADIPGDYGKAEYMALKEALDAVDPEYLARGIEERAREMIIKTEIGLGGDRATGFHDGFTYGLLWGGVLTEEEIVDAHERGVARGLAEIEERSE